MESLLADCKENNELDRITGLLCFNHQYFLQCLEGEEEIVEDTFARIKKDERHQKIQVVCKEPINSRDFENWEMGYVLLSKDIREITDKYLHSDSFSPYSVSNQELERFLYSARELLVKI